MSIVMNGKGLPPEAALLPAEAGPSGHAHA